MMSLLEEFERLLMAAGSAFPQKRTFINARELAYGFVSCWGRRTISRALCACHAQFEDWSASYRVFSRSPWNPVNLFRPILKATSSYWNAANLIRIALDDTTIKKTGKHIPGVSYSRDPMSPPFHFNLQRGQRFIQASVLIRPEELNGPARAIPIRFHPAPPPAKPGKKASEEEIEKYRLAQKTQNLSSQAVELIKEIRASTDQDGYQDRTLLFAVDGSYCNGNVLRNLPPRVEVVGRARDDINLFRLPDNPKGRRKYGDHLPKPKDIRTNDDYPWHQASIFGAGRIHDLSYKVVDNVLWRSGTKAKPLRLIIIAPLRYRPTKKSRLLYRKPAYLLTTDLKTPAEIIIQAYFDRWEIEVNHRDEKSLLGVGHPQVRAEKSTPRVPQFQVAVYAMLLMASLTAYGPKRTDHYLPLPKWRKKDERRPSTLDIIAQLREELIQRAVAISPIPQDQKDENLKIFYNSARKALGRQNSAANITLPNCPVDPATAVLYAFC